MSTRLSSIYPQKYERKYWPEHFPATFNAFKFNKTWFVAFYQQPHFHAWYAWIYRSITLKCTQGMPTYAATLQKKVTKSWHIVFMLWIPNHSKSFHSHVEPSNWCFKDLRFGIMGHFIVLEFQLRHIWWISNTLFIWSFIHNFLGNVERKSFLIWKNRHWSCAVDTSHICVFHT